MQVQNVLKDKINFGWNYKTHKFCTRIALKDICELSESEKEFVINHSHEPDFMFEERIDFGARHFYDVLFEDPSFGTLNDDKNNALSGFINHTNKATKSNNKKDFLTEMAYAVHYLQDGATPPHTEHGNYLHKLFRLPMHKLFEKSKKFGVSSRLDIFERGYMYERLPISSLEMLFHNTALYTVQPENHVCYSNISKWLEIQQRCINRTINVSKAYFEFMMKYLHNFK